MKYANKDMRKAVEYMTEFQNNNRTVYSIRYENAGIYAVYSYGNHWPLWVYDWNSNQWYENVDKYSVTTSRHASHTKPYDLTKSAKANGFISMTCNEIKALIDNKIYTKEKVA